MIFNSDQLDLIKNEKYIIIGSGPAGLTLALDLEKKGISSVVIEGGDLEFNEDSQALYEGRVEGDPYKPLDIARLRQLGGSSMHWGGLCKNLDDFDFNGNKELSIPAWPISKSDLDPYEDRACEILEIDKEKKCSSP